jgi:hypothetical protein
MAEQKTEKSYRFTVGVTVDARGKVKEWRAESGDVATRSEMPPHIDLDGLLNDGSIVEEKN